MQILIGIDDTDNLESRGTGRLAREIATTLAGSFTLLGVTRHQLLVDPRVPYTSHNSSAALALEATGTPDLAALFAQVRQAMLADFQAGSDPGLCLAAAPLPAEMIAEVIAEVIAFGRRAQAEVVTQAEARALAAAHGLQLEGLGGTQDGVIGALAAVGLAASGEDGRYLLVGRTRELSGLQPVAAVLAAGVAAVCTLDGQPVTDGLVQTDKLRPACRAGRPVAYVTWEGDHWQPVKLN